MTRRQPRSRPFPRHALESRRLVTLEPDSAGFSPLAVNLGQEGLTMRRVTPV
jgi:hypothetical protein